MRRAALAIASATLALASAACASDVSACAAACPAPQLAPPEAALRRAVHLTWQDAHRDRAVGYELERRSGGGAWQRVASVSAAEPAHYDDSGGGDGLAPAAYEYRVRGLHRVASGEQWSEWSPAGAVTVREACADAGGELAGLPRVVADDADGDGRHTGKDLERALRRCSEAGGCALEALPVTYDDVAILLSDAPGCEKERTACLTARFPKGLVIEGHGSATVLRSPLWKAPYQPKPLLELRRRPDVRFALRHLVLDGRKQEQSDPKPGQNDAISWVHIGLKVWNFWAEQMPRNRGGCVHDVAVRNFMMRGISLANVERWSIEHSAIEDIGCASSLTPCPRLRVPDAYGPGYKSTGTGISVDGFADDVVIRANRIRRNAKYAIGLKHVPDGAKASIRRPRVIDNDIDESGQLGLFVGGVAQGLFEGNRIAATDSLNPQPEARAFNDTFGISCYGRSEQNVFRRNRLEQLSGIAIMWNCVGRGNEIVETRISGSCRQKGPASCAPGGRGCYMFPDIWMPDGSEGSLALVDNEVVDSGCASPLAVDRTRPGFQLTIHGGRYATRGQAKQPVRFQAVDAIVDRDASFAGATLEFSPRARAVVAPTVSVTGAREPYRIQPGARVLVCALRPAECRALCVPPDMPSWCRPPEPK